jgi:hypothetical protein
MSSSTPISRAELQAIPTKRRLDAIRYYIDHHVVHPVNAAAATGTSCFVPLPKTSGYCVSHPMPYVVTAADLLEGLKAKYPDSCVMFYEKPVPTNRPGVTEQHTGILIDWS